MEKSGRRQKEDLRVDWGKAKWSSELNAGWKMFMARSKKMAPCNFVTCALKLWMAYTFHLGEHGVGCTWSPLSIDSFSPSRKRHGEFWTLNSQIKNGMEKKKLVSWSCTKIDSLSSHFQDLCLALVYFQSLEVSFKPYRDHLQNGFE